MRVLPGKATASSTTLACRAWSSVMLERREPPQVENGLCVKYSAASKQWRYERRPVDVGAKFSRTTLVAG